MRKIFLTHLIIENFKGVKSLSIDFSNETNILGDNGTGKTTVFDGFNWLLFDKDSKDRKEFNIKTLDSEGNVIPGLDHTVTATLNVDGIEMVLSKTYREKWTKKRGEATKQLTGHETIYSINDVPKKKSEYQEAIKNIIDENLFKLITNPLFFSNMKWQDRRQVLLDIIGDISNDRILNARNGLSTLKSLLVNSSVDELKKSLVARKKKLNDEIKSIPFRIDECNNSIVDYNFDEINLKITQLSADLEQIESKLLNEASVNEAIMKQQEEVFALKTRLQELKHRLKLDAEKPKYELQNKISNIDFELRNVKREKELSEKKKVDLEAKLDNYKTQLANLRGEWQVVNSKEFEFDEASFICPTCKRALETEDIDKKKQELLENFNEQKAKNLTEINNRGKNKKIELQSIEDELSELKVSEIDSQIESLRNKKMQLLEELNSFNSDIDIENNEECKKLQNQIDSIVAPMNVDLSGLKNQKNNLISEIDKYKSMLAAKEQNAKLKARIVELEERESLLAQQIADLEGKEFLCEEFIKAKVELLESAINSKFKNVRFKLFDIQINGGLVETCEALVDGVPFSNANSASQINAGLDIINTLNKHYETSAPIFIDNRESVNELIDIDAQIINLIVSTDKKLKVNYGNKKREVI